MENVYTSEHRAAGIGKVNSKHNKFSAKNMKIKIIDNEEEENTINNLNSFRSIEFNAESR